MSPGLCIPPPPAADLLELQGFRYLKMPRYVIKCLSDILFLRACYLLNRVLPSARPEGLLMQLMGLCYWHIILMLSLLKCRKCFCKIKAHLKTWFQKKGNLLPKSIPLQQLSWQLTWGVRDTEACRLGLPQIAFLCNTCTLSQHDTLYPKIHIHLYLSLNIIVLEQKQEDYLYADKAHTWQYPILRACYIGGPVSPYILISVYLLACPDLRTETNIFVELW
jgi:hypothetical protein